MRTTSIRGFKTKEPPPKVVDNDYTAFTAFYQKHFVIYNMSGHWNPRRALAYARCCGVVSDVYIEHRVSDLSGLGRGGIDARFQAIGASIVPVPVTPAQDQDYADQDLDDVWSMEDDA
jgi:hypothetical protein